MKIYISADIEGICGVVNQEQSMFDGKDYAYARNLMVKEVNAAIEGAIQGGAKEIVVCDSHSHQFNIPPDLLHKSALLVTGSLKPHSSMLERLDSSFDGVFFVGYHSRAGTQYGVLNHTYYAKEVQNVRFNGELLGEIGINAALAGYYKVPVCLVTGDKSTIDEAESLLTNVETVAVKEGVGRYAAACVHPETAREAIRTSAEKAIRKIDKECFYKVSSPVALEMDFSSSAMADMVELIPGVTRIGDREVQYTGDDFLEVYKLFRASLLLAHAAMDKYY
jgi:D-amino peptidase